MQEYKSNEPVMADPATGGFLAFLVNSLVAMANDPTNTRFFFPDFLAKVTVEGGKTLVPYQTDFNIGQVAAMRPYANTTLCNNGWATLNGYSGATATDDPSFDIPQATINGLNNARATQWQVDPPTTALQYPLLFSANMNAYTNIPQLTITPASFSFSVTCQTTDQQHEQELGSTGSFQITFNQPSFQMVLMVSFNDDLTASIEIPETYTPDNGTPIPGFQLIVPPNTGLQVQNITLNDAGEYQQIEESLVNEFFGSADASNQVIAMLNQQFGAADVRNDVAAAVEVQFNKIINDLK